MWLEAELAALRPDVVVALGATAAQSLIGPAFRVTKERGKVRRDFGPAKAFLATVHPSSILRGPPADRERAFAAFVADLKKLARWLAGPAR